jgi:hypothetical protein
MADDIELSPRDWVREQTEQILKRSTTEGVEILDRPVVLVTVTGAKTGKKRYVPMMRVESEAVMPWSRPQPAPQRTLHDIST